MTVPEPSPDPLSEAQLERLAEAILTHATRSWSSLPDKPLVMLRSDPGYFMCRNAVDAAYDLAPTIAAIAAEVAGQRPVSRDEGA